jgi:hypothetical protein
VWNRHSTWDRGNFGLPILCPSYMNSSPYSSECVGEGGERGTCVHRIALQQYLGRDILQPSAAILFYDNLQPKAAKAPIPNNSTCRRHTILQTKDPATKSIDYFYLHCSGRTATPLPPLRGYQICAIGWFDVPYAKSAEVSPLHAFAATTEGEVLLISSARGDSEYGGKGHFAAFGCKFLKHNIAAEGCIICPLPEYGADHPYI